MNKIKIKELVETIKKKNKEENMKRFIIMFLVVVFIFSSVFLCVRYNRKHKKEVINEGMVWESYFEVMGKRVEN